MQTRAHETRQTIMAAAVELFDRIGYGDTTLADIIERSGLTKGAFYYHFDSKEAIAAAIVEDTDRKIAVAVATAFDTDAPTLHNLIQSFFAVEWVLNSDRAAHVGRLLIQSNNQITVTGPRAGLDMTARVIDVATPLVDAFGPHCGVSGTEIAEVLWLTLSGHYLMSGARIDTLDEAFRRLARVWRVMVAAIVPPEDIALYHRAIDDIARTYAGTGA